LIVNVTPSSAFIPGNDFDIFSSLSTGRVIRRNQEI